MKERNLDYFMGLKYNILMKKVEDVFCAFIPELSLFAEGKSASEAYENLEQEKLKYFRRVLLADAGSSVREPLAITMRKSFLDALLLFGTKTLVVGVIFGIILAVLFPSIDLFVSTFHTRIKPVKYIEFMIDQVDNKLSNMSENEQVEMKMKVRRIAHKIKPFTDEFRITDDKNINKLGPPTK